MSKHTVAALLIAIVIFIVAFTILYLAQGAYGVTDDECIAFDEPNFVVVDPTSDCFWVQNKVIYERNFEVKDCAAFSVQSGFAQMRYCILGPK